MRSPHDHTREISIWTAWLRAGEADLTCSRIGLLLRRQGIDPKRVVCAKIFPDISDPINGVIITPDKKIFQFGYNLSGMTAQMAEFEEWLDITSTYQNHRWRDEILTALKMFQ